MKAVAAIFIAASMFALGAPETAKTAPKEVDQALRARISEFYRFEVEGKYHQAEQLVADDTKDLYVGSSKPIYYGFEIEAIKYTPDFTEAEATIIVSRQVAAEGFMGHPLKTKQISRWKIEHGLWCYFVDPKRDLPRTPFAPGLPPGMPVSRATIPGPAAPPGALFTMGAPSAAPPPLTTMPTVPTRLQASKATVNLKSSAASSDQVIISNPTPYPVTLILSDPGIPGLTITLKPAILKPFGRATLDVSWSGKSPARPLTFKIQTKFTRQVIPIRVTFGN